MHGHRIEIREVEVGMGASMAENDRRESCRFLSTFADPRLIPSILSEFLAAGTIGGDRCLPADRDSGSATRKESGSTEVHQRSRSGQTASHPSQKPLLCVTMSSTNTSSPFVDSSMITVFIIIKKPKWTSSRTCVGSLEQLHQIVSPKNSGTPVGSLHQLQKMPRGTGDP